MARVRWATKTVLRVHTKVRDIIRVNSVQLQENGHVASRNNADTVDPDELEDLIMNATEMAILLSDHMPLQSLALQMQRPVSRCLWDCIDSMTSPACEVLLDTLRSQTDHDLRACEVCNMCDAINKQRSQSPLADAQDEGFPLDATDAMRDVTSSQDTSSHKDVSTSQHGNVRDPQLKQQNYIPAGRSTSSTTSRLSTPPSSPTPPPSILTFGEVRTQDANQEHSSSSVTSHSSAQGIRKRQAPSERGVYVYGNGKEVPMPPGWISTTEAATVRALLPWDPDKLAKEARKSGVFSEDTIMFDDGIPRKKTRSGKKG